ncbi:hypothetical protein HY636_04570 [Candidatus Woesearchaeota archaeon]|nr:hypothetical protein [Candidatus Woesearchaeota archaeon]
MNDLFTITSCKTKQSCKAKLNKRQNLNLKNLKEKFNIVSDAGIALVLSVDGVEVVVHGYGELIFKIKTGKNKVSQAEIEKIAKKIFDVCL